MPHTASATSSGPPPANTPSRANRRRSSASRRSWLQSMAPRRVRWRSGRSRPPADRRPSRSPSRWAIAAGDRRRTRAAASSMASGRPSSRRTISATAAPFSAVSVNSGRTAIARSTNRRTASDAMRTSTSVAPAGGSDSGGTVNSCSPEIRSGARLDTMTVRRGAPRRRSATIGAADTTCSKLSRTSSACRSRRWSRTRSIGGWRGASRPIEAAIAEGTSSGSVTGASGTNHAPSGNRSTQSPASASERRVLPVPPGPVRVSSRVFSSRPTAASTSARPTKLVSCGGRLLGVASSVRSAGNVASRPSASSWYRRSGRARSLSRCSPRSRSAMPGPGSPASARAASVTTTWPPCAAAATRAARWTSRPT